MPDARLFSNLLAAVIVLVAPLFYYGTPAARAPVAIKPAATLTLSRRLHMAGDRRASARPKNLRRLIYTVTATGYEAVPGQTDSEPFVTADNSRIRANYGSKKRWLALSNDLLKRWGGPFDYGDKVLVTGISPALDGVYTLHDTMNRRHRHCLDVLVHPSEKLDIYQKGVKIQRVAP